MQFASDNTSGAAPEVMAAVIKANEGYERSYGADASMERVTALVREIFEAPQAVVHLVSTGTAANALAIATHCPPWGAVFCHSHAHIAEDECNAPEFYSGAKLVLVPGDHGQMTSASLAQALSTTGEGGVHGVQRGMLSLTNVTEAGTVYAPAAIAALTQQAKAFDLPSHLDGARFANALVATGATPAEMTWKAGIDVLSLGGTKNGCLGVEGVVFFNPEKAWEFELRRKRGGHLFSKHRYLSAQMEAYLTDGLWLRLAAHANAMGQRLVSGLRERQAQVPEAPANMVFPEWGAGHHDRLEAAGAQFYRLPAPPGHERARLVASWSTTGADVDRFFAAF
jgi:threonine aldolase